MRTSAMLFVALAGMACTPTPPAPPAPVTLAWFEGEIDPVAGTFTVRPVSAPAGEGGASGRLVVPEGDSALTISNPKTGPGSPTKVTNGCGAGANSLDATVTIALHYSAPQFVGAIYAELTSLVPSTGYTSCNSSPAPTGLSAQYGLWSYGTVRPNATSVARPWKFGFPSSSAQTSRFTGRIVGVPGTTFTADLPLHAAAGATRSPNIVYARETMAYLATNGTLVYVNLSGSAGSVLTLPQPGRSIAFQAGAGASSDVLWFTTPSYVGVVYQGAVHSVQTSARLDDPDGLGSIVVDPTTPNRAWFLGQWRSWFRSVQFDPATKGLSLGTAYAIPGENQAPYGLAIAPARKGSTGSWIYVTGNVDIGPITATNYFRAYDLSGTLQKDIMSVAGYPGECLIPFTPIVGPGNVLWFASYRNEGTSGTDYHYYFCTYDPGADTFAVVPVGTDPTYSAACGGAGVGPAVGPEGTGSAVWGIGIDPAAGRQSARQLVGAADAQFAAEWATSVGWGWDIASIASSPAVTVGGTSYPAYLWVTTATGILRMQP